MKLKGLILLGAVALWSCSSSEPVVKKNPNKPAPIETKIEEPVVTKTEEVPLDWSKTRLTIESKEDYKIYGLEDKPEILNPPKKEPQAPKQSLSLTKEKKGYRIQIYTTNIKRAADEVQTEARVYYGYKVYVSFRAPIYSVKIGNYATIDQAKLDLDKVLEKYRHATVVPDFIEK